MSNPSKSISARLPEFDLLRSLSIIGVVIIHVTGALDAYAKHGLFLYYVMVVIHLAQRFCVPAFLIISGFFLTYKINNQQNSNEVLKKRLSRVIPPYIFWSLAFDLLYVILGKRQFNLLTLIVDLLAGSASGPYYFMIVIIQCYFFWWLTTKLKISNYTKLLYVSIVVHLMYTIYFYLITLNYVSAIPLLDRWIFCWSFYFVFGLFLGKHYDAIKKVVQRMKIRLIIATILLLVLNLVEFHFIYTSDLPQGTIFVDPSEINWAKAAAAVSFSKISSLFYAIGFSLLVLSLYNQKYFSPKITILMSKLADFSFPIYLIHGGILTATFKTVDHLLGQGSIATFMVLLVIGLGGSYAFIYICCKILPRKYARYVFGL